MPSQFKIKNISQIFSDRFRRFAAIALTNASIVVNWRLLGRLNGIINVVRNPISVFRDASEDG
jgi:hypothetical protein